MRNKARPRGAVGLTAGAERPKLARSAPTAAPAAPVNDRAPPLHASVVIGRPDLSPDGDR